MEQTKKGTGITGHTHMVAMIGSPVEHSASPATHSLAYQKMGIDAVFWYLTSE